MANRRIRNLAVAGITIVSAALLTALSATGASAAASAPIHPAHVGVAANNLTQAASAATARVNMPAQPVPFAFRLENAHSGLCIDEDGDTGLIALDTCNQNHSQYWYFFNNGEPLENAHSGECLQVDGYSTTVPVSATTCDGNTSQAWDLAAGSILTPNAYLFINVHSGLCLQGQGTVLYQGGGDQCADGYDTIFNWYEV
jgi:hypothetical protein